MHFSDTSLVSYSSTKFWHCLPGHSIRSHRLGAQPCKTVPAPPTSYTSCKSRLSSLLLTPTPSLGSINWLEQLMVLRGAFYLLDYLFIIKGIGRWKRWEDKVWGKGSELPCSPLLCHPLKISQVFTKPESFLNPVLLDFCGGFIR